MQGGRLSPLGRSKAIETKGMFYLPKDSLLGSVHSADLRPLKLVPIHHVED